MRLNRLIAPGLLVLLGLSMCKAPTSGSGSSPPSKPLLSAITLDQDMIDAGFALSEGRLSLTDRNLRLVLSSGGGAPLRESYQVHDQSGQWIEALDSSDAVGGGERLRYARESQAYSRNALAFDRVLLLQGGERGPGLVLVKDGDGFRLEKTIRIDREAQGFHIQVTFKPLTRLSLKSLESHYRFTPAGSVSPPDFVWTPCLRPEKEDVIADHCFRSPAIVLQKGNICSSLIPDLSLYDSGPRIRTVLDLNCGEPQEPLASFGFADWRTRGHVYYQRTDSDTALPAGMPLSYGFHLLINPDAARGQGYRDTVRFLWKQYGRAGLQGDSGLLTQSLQAWEREAFERYAANLYLSIDLPGIRGGILRTKRARWSNEGTNDDAWFSAWFQAIRTAYGMLLHGNETKNPALMEKARRVIDLVFSAPRNDGIFPTIFCLSEDGKSGQWFLDSGWAGYPDCYHAFDCAWTGCWLLEVAALEESYTARVTEFLRPFADFLVENQLESGCIPSFYDGSTLELREGLTPYFSAETAGSALFLARISSMTGEQKYLNCALRAMDFITREVLPECKWFDFETYLSCSRKPFGFYDTYTRQHPQNTLSMIQAAWAYLELYKLTRDQNHLVNGENVLDYLSLYQQVWSPPFLNAPLFGGFGVQNTDAEWSDARGCYASDLFFDYYLVTEKREYLERGVSALKAGFGIGPNENWGHDGKDGPGSNAGFHWGVGSAAVTAITQRKRMGDIHIHLDESYGVALNRVQIENLQVDRHRVTFDIKTSCSDLSETLVKFSGLQYGIYQLKVNGKELGNRTAPELKEGLVFDL